MVFYQAFILETKHFEWNLKFKIINTPPPSPKFTLYLLLDPIGSLDILEILCLSVIVLMGYSKFSTLSCHILGNNKNNNKKQKQQKLKH